MSKATSALGGAASGAATGAAVAGPYGAIIGGVIGGIKGLFGGGKSDEEKAYEEALASLQNLPVPDAEKRRIVLERLQSTGQVSPEMATAIEQKETELGNVSTDPRLRQAQLDALARMQRVGQEGFTIEDKAALESAQKDIGRANRGRDEAIMQNLAARGQGGSGAELAARLANAQGAAEQSNTVGTNLASLASQRTLQGIEQSGQMAGNLRNQDYSEASRAAEAQDAINRFNAQNKQNVNLQNTGTSNEAQRLNLENTQNIANKNVGLENEQNKYNTQVNQDVYKDQLQRINDIKNLKAKKGEVGQLNQANQEKGQAAAWESAGTLAKGLKDSGALKKIGSLF